MTYQPRHRAPHTNYSPTGYFGGLAPAQTVDFWRHEQDVADMHAGLRRIKEALDVPGPGAMPSQTTPGPGHQPYEVEDVTP